MLQPTEHKLTVLYNEPVNKSTDVELEDVFQMLDELHTAASEGALHSVTTLNKRDLLAWLQDVIYTAQETIAEINHHEHLQQPVLRVVERPQADKRHA